MEAQQEGQRQKKKPEKEKCEKAEEIAKAKLKVDKPKQGIEDFTKIQQKPIQQTIKAEAESDNTEGKKKKAKVELKSEKDQSISKQAKKEKKKQTEKNKSIYEKGKDKAQKSSSLISKKVKLNDSEQKLLEDGSNDDLIYLGRRIDHSSGHKRTTQTNRFAKSPELKNHATYEVINGQ